MRVYKQNHRFIAAVRSGDLGLVRKLSRNAGFFAENHGTALLVAVTRNDLQMVRFLLRCGAKVEPARYGRGETKLLSPLWLAVLNGHRGITNVLIDAGADVNGKLSARCEDERTIDYCDETSLLHVAVTNRDYRLICKLLRAGADADAKNASTESVLQLAIESGCPDWIVQQLLDYGASATHSTSTGRSVLHYAIRSGRSTLTGILMDHGADPFDVHCSGRNSLYFAADAEMENTRIAEMLIDEGVDIHAPDRITLCTPLHVAAKTGKRDMARLLVEHGADVAAVAKDGTSPLFLAIEAKNTAIVRDLLSYGADAKEVMDITLSMLHCACAVESKEIIELLLENGADVRLKDCMERTPLMMVEDREGDAARTVVKECVRLGDELDEVNRGAIRDNAKLAGYYNQCLKEIERMKSTDVYNGITYHDIFTRSDERIAALLRNDEFVENLAWLEYDYLFPVYSNELGEKLSSAERIRDQKWQMEDCIGEAFGFRMPIVVIDKIVEYL